MRRVDRLIEKAKSKSVKDKIILAFVYPSYVEQGKWIARADCYTESKEGCVKSEETACLTLDDAVSEIDKMLRRYPGKKDIPIIIDDI